MSVQPEGRDSIGGRVYDLASRRSIVPGLPIERDAETVEIPADSEGVPVDRPEPRRPAFAAVDDRTRPPIIPVALRSRATVAQLLRAAAAEVGYRVGTHLYHAPAYLAKTVLYAPYGLARIVGRQVRWWWHPELTSMLGHAASTNDLKTGPGVQRQLSQARKARGMWLAVELAALAVAVPLAGQLAPWWVLAATAAAAVVALAYAGRPAGKPITVRTSMPARYYRLTAEATRAAIVACGVGVRDPAAVKFPRDIFRDGPGHSAIVDLPAEPVVITADAVISKRVELAGALRLPKSQVWPATIPGEHPSRLQLWVAERPVNDMPAPPWELLTKGRTDYWRPFVYGYDERMQPVTWRLDERNSLFAGIPGTGKSRSVRVVLLGGICDPIVVPIVFELKGLGDYDPVAPLCPEGMYGSGADEHTKLAALDAMEWLLAECDRRGPRIKRWVDRLGLDENKLTRQIAERDPQLRPILAVFDEVQELFASRNKDIRTRAIDAATSLVKRGRAMGIHVILATQRIDDKAIPVGVSSNIANRLCLGVYSHTEVELVLGTGTYRRGARPTEFEPGPDSGWGWVVGLGKMRPVKAVNLDNKAAHLVVARAVAMRAGLDGADVANRAPRDFLADLRGVYRVGEAWVAWPTLATRMAEAYPDAYPALTPDAVSSQARSLGVESVSGKVRDAAGRVVKRDGRELVARGAKAEHVDAALPAAGVDDA